MGAKLGREIEFSSRITMWHQVDVVEGYQNEGSLMEVNEVASGCTVFAAHERSSLNMLNHVADVVVVTLGLSRQVVTGMICHGRFFRQTDFCGKYSIDLGLCIVSIGMILVPIPVPGFDSGC